MVTCPSRAQLSARRRDRVAQLQPLAPPSCAGKVVLVDFWTYTCINWLRTLPYIRAWAKEYRDDGLVVVGVHTPEFAFEHDLDNVRRAVKDMGDRVSRRHRQRLRDLARVRQPLLAGPLLRRRGRERSATTSSARGATSSRSASIQQLLGASTGELVSVDGRRRRSRGRLGRPALAGDLLGYGEPTRVAERRSATTRLRPRCALNHWALAGDWTIGREVAVAERGRGRIAFRFHARDLHLVLGPAARGPPVRFRVALDGERAR